MDGKILSLFRRGSLLRQMYYGGYEDFDGANGGVWKKYINIPIKTIPLSETIYVVKIDSDYVSVYSADGKLKAQAPIASGFWDLVRSDGNDIRAFDHLLNQLYFSLDEFDYENKLATIRVILPKNSEELNIAFGNNFAIESIYKVQNPIPSWATVMYLDIANATLDLASLKSKLESDGISYEILSDVVLPYLREDKSIEYKIYNSAIKFVKPTSDQYTYHTCIVTNESIIVLFSHNFSSPDNSNLFRTLNPYSTQHQIACVTSRVGTFEYGAGTTLGYILDETLDYIYTNSGNANTLRATFLSVLIDDEGYMLQGVTNDYGTGTSESWIQFDISGVGTESVVKAWLRGGAANNYADVFYVDTWYVTVDADVTDKTKTTTTPKMLTRDPAAYGHAAGATIVIIGVGDVNKITYTKQFADQSGYDWCDEVYINKLLPFSKDIATFGTPRIMEF